MIDIPSRAERIAALLRKELSPSLIELYDDSHKHAGHAGAQPGGQTHYRLIIESEKLRGLSKVQCHQAIYKILDSEFKGGLHALAIQASAPKE